MDEETLATLADRLASRLALALRGRLAASIPLAGAPLLTPAQAAAYLAISGRSLRRYGSLVPRTLLPSPTGGRARVRYRVTDLDRWIAAVNDPRSRIVAGWRGRRRR